MAWAGESVVAGTQASASHPELIDLRQFIAAQFGRDTEFFKELENQSKKTPLSAAEAIRVADAVISAVANGRYQLRSLRAKAETSLTDDMLDQADRLLSLKKFHPAAGLLLAVASLEQFLRASCERAGVAPTKQCPTIEDLKGKLRQNDLISDGEAKDVTRLGLAAQRCCSRTLRRGEARGREARTLGDPPVHA